MEEKREQEAQTACVCEVDLAVSHLGKRPRIHPPFCDLAGKRNYSEAAFIGFDFS